MSTRPLIFLSAFVLLLGGCLQQQTHVPPEGGGIWAFAITEDTPPYIVSDEGDAIYLVEETVELPLRLPTDLEIAAQADVGDQMIPFTQLPWLERGDVELQVHWTLSNLSDAAVEIDLTLNGLNEFHEYFPQIEVDDDELVVGFSQWERRFRIEAGERRSGVIHEEQLDEVTVDLATVANMPPNPNLIVYFENHSAIDPRAQPFIPPVIPALTGVRMGLRSSGANNLVLEFSVRVRDARGGLLASGDQELWVHPARVLLPLPPLPDPLP